MAKHFVSGSKEWVEAFREGGFVGKHPVLPEPPPHQPIIGARFRPLPLKHHHGRPCPYCRNTMLIGSRRKPTREHLIPKSRGGDLSPDNRLIVCSPCNGDKGDMLIKVWLYWLRKNDDPRAPYVAIVCRARGLNELR